MKLIMKTKITIAVLSVCLALASCAKNNDFVSREETTVTVDCLSQSVDQNLRARGDWYIDENGADWLSVSPKSGTGDGMHFQMYTISVSYNKGGSREATIYVCQGDLRCPVTVHQNRCKFAFTGVEVVDSLYQHKESTTGINVKYEYAAGDESVKLSAALEGEAASGLSVTSFTSTDFTPGNGALFIPITGKPSSKGEFSVTVFADGKNVGNCKGQVAEYVAPVVVLDPSGLPAKWNFFAAGYTGTGPLETERGKHWDYGDPDPMILTTCGNTEAKITTVIKKPVTTTLNDKAQCYTYNPAMQVYGLVEGDYWLATIPVMYFTETTKISVEAATSTASKGPGFYILEYSGDGTNWFEAPGATTFTKDDGSGDSWKAHYWNNKAATTNAPSGTRKSYNPENPDETYHKYVFPLTGVTIDDGCLYLRLRALRYKYDMSGACAAAWTDLKVLEVDFVEE